MYTKTKILPAYPEYIQDSNRPPDERAIYNLDFRAAFKLCKLAKYMTDFSVIQGDGGGTQYTFLEAIDAGTICLLHKDWIKSKDSMIDTGDNQNCIAFKDWTNLVNFLNGEMSQHTAAFIRTNSTKLLQTHEAVRVAEQYAGVVQ